jgi:hypothetical protein
MARRQHCPHRLVDDVKRPLRQVRVLGEGATLSLYVSRISFLHSSHPKVETEMNQFPFLIINLPQRLH